jgi:microcystin-dependent protein
LRSALFHRQDNSITRTRSSVFWRPLDDLTLGIPVPIADGAPGREAYRAGLNIGAKNHEVRVHRAEEEKMDQFVGQIIAVGFNFAPTGWVLCDGRLLPISEYDVLFTLLGTTFGGDGQNTFAVPDLRGRSPLGQGSGPGLPPAFVGQVAGSEQVTLTGPQIAAHSHPLMASSGTGTVSKPSSATVLANQSNALVSMYGQAPGNATLAPPAIGSAGGNQPHENRQPYKTVNYIISTVGIYPSQS